jgi:hypothetical protein
MLARATAMTGSGTNGSSGVGVRAGAGAPSTQLVGTEAEKNQEEVCKMQHNAVDLEPLFCAFASTAEELDKTSEVIASTPWDGDLARAREGRLCVCTMMGVQMISRPACSSGKPLMSAPSSMPLPSLYLLPSTSASFNHSDHIFHILSLQDLRSQSRRRLLVMNWILTSLL